MLIHSLAISFSLSSYAHDTDIYLASGEGVQPNILIIFDNSGSMADDVACKPDDTKLYEKVNNPWGRILLGGVCGFHRRRHSEDWGDACPVVRTHLEGTGYHDGYTTLRRGNCTRNDMTLATGVWINTHDPSGSTLCQKLMWPRE